MTRTTDALGFADSIPSVTTKAATAASVKPPAPVARVKQGPKRRTDPDILTLARLDRIVAALPEHMRAVALTMLWRKYMPRQSQPSAEDDNHA
mgnify:CR=1 FL=1